MNDSFISSSMRRGRILSRLFGAVITPAAGRALKGFLATAEYTPNRRRKQPSPYCVTRCPTISWNSTFRASRRGLPSGTSALRDRHPHDLSNEENRSRKALANREHERPIDAHLGDHRHRRRPDSNYRRRRGFRSLLVDVDERLLPDLGDEQFTSERRHPGEIGHPGTEREIDPERLQVVVHLPLVGQLQLREMELDLLLGETAGPVRP